MHPDCEVIDGVTIDMFTDEPEVVPEVCECDMDVLCHRPECVKRFQAEADYWATASVVKALSDEEARDIYSHRPAKAEAYIGLKLVR